VEGKQGRETAPPDCLLRACDGGWTGGGTREGHNGMSKKSTGI